MPALMYFDDNDRERCRPEMTLFALLHGGMHRGRCWDSVRAELHRRGHRTIAPDLPVDANGAGAQEWAAVAAHEINRAVGMSDTDVVAVGHSISGLMLPVLAAGRPVRKLVFVGGLIPVPAESFADHLAGNADAITFPAPAAGGTGAMGLTWDAVRDGFYHDCPVDIADRAFAELRRQSFTVFVERCPVDVWPDVPSTYILLREDRAIGSRWARRNAVERIGAKLVELDGGHSPFYSRPAELAGVLADE